MKRTLLFFLSLVISSWGYAQSVSPEVTATAGDHFTGADAQLSWTVGELMIETYDDGSNQLTQGFHQTNLVVTSVKDLEEKIQVKVFPNPTTDMLSVEVRELADPLSFSLYDVDGKQLLLQKTFNESKTIDLTSLAAGTYFLQLSNEENKTIKTFKILKIK